MLRSMWLFKHKFHADGTLSRYKDLFVSPEEVCSTALERDTMVTCNPTRTLVDIESKLGPEGVPVQDPTLYRNLAGGSTNSKYLSICFGGLLLNDNTPSPIPVPKQNIRVLLTLSLKLHEFVNLLRELNLLYMNCHSGCTVDIVTGHVRVLHVPSCF
ncbi:hypothetical protein Tco_0555407 [Tanacetum coccineum]